METFVIRNAEATILCSEKRREQIEPAHPKELCYIHNSPHINALRFDGEGERVCKSDSSRLKLVYVGNFCADRWILELLENVSKMPTKVEMHIGGIGGLSDQVNAYAEKYENIFAYGKMKYQDVLKLESECDCLAALYETHIRNHVYAAPNKFYEALALGKPLLMIEGSGMSEIVEREHLGVLMKPTAESFESALSEIQELIQTDKTLKERMKKLFEERYSRTIMEKRLTNLYEQIVGK